MSRFRKDNSDKGGVISGISDFDNMRISSRKVSSGTNRRMSESFVGGRNFTISPDFGRLSFRSSGRRNSIQRQFSLRLNRNKIGFSWVSFCVMLI